MYQQVITKIATIFDEYDKTKKTPVYGFGAKSQELKLKRVSHNFYVSGDSANPFAEGDKGILDMYKKVLPKLEFLGPTYLSPLIKSVTNSVAARYKSDPLAYCVLVIIMDGLISDFEETIETIIDSSEYPLSVLIVGVGDEDFHQLEFLDSDGSLLRGERQAPGPDGKPVQIQAKRDIVQFVNYNKLSNKDEVISSALAEIPE